jgi:hypothetical protein
MNKSQLFKEQIRLFDSMWDNLERERHELKSHYIIARNFACSEWYVDTRGSLSVDKIIQDRLPLLNINFERFKEEISRRQYLLILTFSTIFKKAKKQLTQEQKLCFDYWLKKDEK